VDRIDGYLVEGEVARGGMGVVYRVRDSQGQVRALKLLQGAGEGQRKRFQREIEALRRLRHPGIVPIRAAGEHAGQPYLVMDLVEGTSMQQRIELRGPLPIQVAVELIAELADALAHAHAQGVLHRDLKPDNVLLTPGGVPLLTDFGLARELDGAQTRLTRTGTFLGTPGYWPPEQARGDLAAVDARSDVYGLGATLYAALTGQAPGSTDLIEALRSEREVAPPSHLREQVDARLEAICLRCLRLDPGARYPSAEALGQALTDYLSGSTRAGRPGLLVGVLVAGLLVAVGAAGWWARRSGVTPSASPQADAPAASSVASLEELLAEAEALLAAEETDYEALDGLASRVLELDPEHARAWYLRGQARYGQDSPETALPDLDRAVELGEPEAFYTRAMVHTELEQHRPAVSDYLRALELTPDDAELHFYLGNSLRRLGDVEDALAVTLQGLELAPDDPWLHSALGVLRRDLGDLPGAEEALDRALELEPEHQQALETRGRVRAEGGNLLGGVADYTALIEDHPKRADYWGHRGTFHYVLEDYPEALADFERAVALAPEDPQLLFYRGLGRRRTGDQQGALADFEQALVLRPDHPESLRERGMQRAVTGDLPGGIRDFERFLAVTSSDHPGRDEVEADLRETQETLARGGEVELEEE
jgi:tetratricopeptide (TPR) repeat protein